MPRISVQEAVFDLAAESAALAAGRDDIGGIASFVGICRADDGIAAEAERRWPLTGCTIIHRVGRLEPGAPIVLVLTASAHRSAALESCAFLIDWLKTGAPFWKREEFADGTTRWVEARAEDAAATSRW